MPAPFKYELNSEQTAVTIEIDGNTISLTTAELESAIQWLGQVRAQLHPEVPRELEANTPIIRTEAWSFLPYGDKAAQTGALLSLRSQYLGWFCQSLSPFECQELLRLIIGKASSEPHH
jgi:hypothetical protein